MNVKELKEALEGVDDDVEVYVYADHGQDCSAARCASGEYIYLDESENYMLHPDDIEEYDEGELAQGFVITD